MVKFRLYVVGNSLNSDLAIANLSALCRTYLPDRHEIEIVDVALDPKRALIHGIFVTPTLIKLSPALSRMIVGTLSDAKIVLQALELKAEE
jgi:circadian clock protein KaiB